MARKSYLKILKINMCIFVSSKKIKTDRMPWICQRCLHIGPQGVECSEKIFVHLQLAVQNGTGIDAILCRFHRSLCPVANSANPPGTIAPFLLCPERQLQFLCGLRTRPERMNKYVQVWEVHCIGGAFVVQRIASHVNGGMKPPKLSIWDPSGECTGLSLH